MDYFLVLLIVYSCLFFLSTVIFNLKILSPSIIFTASFTLMLYLAYVTREMMGFSVSEKTFKVLAIGGLLFVINEFFVMFSHQLLHHKSLCNNFYTTKRVPLYIKKSTLNYFLLIISFSFGLALLSILTSTSGSVGNRMETYKNMMLYDTGNVKFRFLLNQLFKINTAISYVCAYIGIYNWLIIGEKFKKQVKYFFIVAIYIIYTFFSQGARQPAIEIVIFMFLMYFAWKLKRSERRDLLKSVGRLVIMAPFAAVLFTKTAELVGRRAAERQVLKYISTYFCGGLYAFNLHINEPARNKIWGQSSFADIYQILIKLGLVPDSYAASYHSFNLYGNTVTMFGRWYEDFGFIGVCIMTIIVSMFFSTLFYKYICPSVKNQELHLSKIIYGKLVIALVWAGYDDRIRALFSMSNILYVLLIIIVYKFFVERHYHIKIH